MKKVKRFLLERKSTWELLQEYREHFGKNCQLLNCMFLMKGLGK